ncbi:MAG: ketoacyl-ACP synthase III [Bacteroidales bacterium]|nr:ketoacyl-ACP synthase III [Bacteroidales bacterium]
MSKIKAAITGVHGWVPEDILTNKELATMVDTSDEWILTRTGIKERHILKDKATSEIAVHAVNGLLEKTNTSPDEIDFLICTTITPDMVFPATANIICDKCGIKNAFSYDIEAACSGFIYSIATASKFIESGTHKKVIVVGVDKMSSIIDYTDRQTCVIFGDGGGAVLLEPNKDGVGIIDSIFQSDGLGAAHLHMKAGGSLKPASHETIDAKEHFVYQEGKVVFKFAVTKMADSAIEIMGKNNITSEDMDWLVPHQANTRIIEAVAKRMNIPKEKVMINIEKYGNTTCGTIPLLLWEWENKLKKGDRLVMTAFGGGFTWGSIYLKWAYDPK